MAVSELLAGTVTAPTRTTGLEPDVVDRNDAVAAAPTRTTGLVPDVVERNDAVRPILFRHSGDVVFEDRAPVKSLRPCAPGNDCVVDKLRRPLAICDPAKLGFPRANVGVVMEDGDACEVRNKF